MVCGIHITVHQAWQVIVTSMHACTLHVASVLRCGHAGTRLLYTLHGICCWDVPAITILTDHDSQEELSQSAC